MSAHNYRPDSLRILGREFKIDYDDDLGSLGLCDAERAKIAIQEGQSVIEEADTILHEALHGLHYLFYFGLSRKVEEKVVRGTSTGLIQIFLDNPDFLKYLTKVVNSQRR